VPADEAGGAGNIIFHAVVSPFLIVYATSVERKMSLNLLTKL